MFSFIINKTSLTSVKHAVVSLKPIVSLRHKWTDQNTELNTNQKEREREVREDKYRYLAFIFRVDINIFTQYADVYSSKLSSKH